MKAMIEMAVTLLFLVSFFAPARAQHPAREFQLRAETPAFWDLVAHDARLETLATGFGFTEGPVWDPAGFIYVSDEEQNKIFRVYSDGHREEVIALGDPDGNTYDHNQKLLDCASVLRAIIRIEPDGKYQTLADHFEGKRFNSPNDVVMGPMALFISPIQHWIFRLEKSRRSPFREFTGWMQTGTYGCLQRSCRSQTGWHSLQTARNSMWTIVSSVIFASTIFSQTAR